MRPHRSGSITRLPTGRYRVQVSVDGRRRSLGVYATRDEAEAILAGANAELADSERHDGVTLRDWGSVALDRRETQGLRGVDEERSRWAAHIEHTELARLPVRHVTRGDVQRWLDVVLLRRARGPRASGRPIARRTASNALTLLRAVLEDAHAHGVCASNVARDVRLPRARGVTHEPWTYLTPDEQARLLEACPAHAKPMVAFALYTGLRQGEQWALRLADVHLDDLSPHVMIRYGRPGLPTKSGRIRRVDLLPAAVDAVRAQLEVLGAQTRRASRTTRPGPGNPHGLLFPSVRGTARKRGAPRGWEQWVEAAQLGRPLRWHDLRHTCASSLIAGWWGRAWTLVEVRAMLGHSSVQVTERYAHLAGTITQVAVAETVARVQSDCTRPGSTEDERMTLSARNYSGSHLRDLNSRPTVYETGPVANDLEPLGVESAHACAELRGLARCVAALGGEWDWLDAMEVG
jgi:integrase